MTLIRVTANYLDPENYNLDHLKALAEREDDDEMQVFKSELRQALRDPARLPGDELFESVEYGNGSDEAFLIWLWHELYGDEPFEASVLTRPKVPLPAPLRLLHVLKDFLLLGAVPEPWVACREALAFGGAVDGSLDCDPVADAPRCEGESRGGPAWRKTGPGAPAVRH